jgi:ABC-type phosphate transport system substrate-binding protein
MKRLLTAFTVAAALVLCGCRNQETKVIEHDGKATELRIQGSNSTIKVETVMIDGVEYLVLHDEMNQRFAVCPKVNGKHAK